MFDQILSIAPVQEQRLLCFGMICCLLAALIMTSFMHRAEDARGANLDPSLALIACEAALIVGSAAFVALPLFYPISEAKGSTLSFGLAVAAFVLAVLGLGFAGSAAFHRQRARKDQSALKWRSSESSFRPLFENNPIPTWAFDRETLRFLAVNPAALEHYGYGEAELLEKTVLDLRPEADHEPFLKALANTDTIRASGMTRRHLKANNEIIEVSVYATALTYEGRDAVLVTAVDITERQQAEQRLAHLADHDALTNLANHHAFSRRLAEAIEQCAVGGTGFAILSINLDHFKDVNDTFGHAAADVLLRECSTRMSEVAGQHFVARIGGDDFLLIVASSDQPDAAAKLADRLHGSMRQRFLIDGTSTQLGFSIGVGLYPADAQNANALIAASNAALSRAKHEGRGVTRFYRPELDAKVCERKALLADLRGALERSEYCLYYQPQFSFDDRLTHDGHGSGRSKVAGLLDSNNREWDARGEAFSTPTRPVLVGFEALIRWRQPQRGLVAPETFISLLEQSGTILPVAEWALMEACRQAASWPAPISVAVNLSPIQFRHDDLVDIVQGVLDATGLSANRLELEITEGIMLEDHQRTLAILWRLKSMGIRIAMDDFGTGYSSLSYLLSFPFDKIKIDQAFVANLGGFGHAEAIVRAIIGLGRGLDLPVIAEGVETQQQLDFLAREGCDELQGYLLGHPMPIGAYAGLLQASTNRRFGVIQELAS